MSALIADRRADRRDLERLEDEVHRLADDEPEQDEDRRDEQRDLEARPEAHRHRELHLVLEGELDGDEVLGEVADRRDEDRRRRRTSDSPNGSMNGSIAPTRISDRTASRTAAASSTKIATYGRSRPARRGPRPSVAAERLGRVRELEDERQDVARHQQDRDEDRLLGRGCLRSAIGRRRGEDRRDEQPDGGQDEERRIRAGDLPVELLRAVLAGRRGGRSPRGRAAGCR